MARGKNSDSPGELLQIVILTLAMTGGGFCLLYVGLRFWMIPEVVRKVDIERRDYEKLVELLESSDMVDLRANHKEQEDSNQESLAQIIDEERQLKRLSFSSRTPGRPKTSGQIVEESQTLKLEAAPMRDIVEFIARVRHAKKTVRIESFNLKRASRSRSATAEDAWIATVQIVEFKSKA